MMTGVLRPTTGPRVERLEFQAYQVLGLRDLSPRFSTRAEAEGWLEDQLERIGPARQPRQRRCLRCGHAFQSEGFHNRMCDPCRHVSDAGAMTITPRATGKVRRAARC